MSANTMIANDSQIKTYSSSLFNANESLVDRLHDQPAPMETYLALNKPFVEGFRQSLQTHSAYELDMNVLEHADLLHYFDNISAKMNTTESIIDEHNRSLLAVAAPFDPDGNA
ncbi:hypothetical protein KA013_00445 [Patescibacteria group bacterium]|nr:hypothetical protein [Patescibacteria group bacterium]